LIRYPVLAMPVVMFTQSRATYDSQAREGVERCNLPDEHDLSMENPFGQIQNETRLLTIGTALANYRWSRCPASAPNVENVIQLRKLCIGH
jgi:hypothetical protein